MKFKGSISLALLLSGSLLLGACTSGEAPDAQNSAGGSNGTAAGQSGDIGGDPCLKKLGNTESADGVVSLTAGPGDWNGYNAQTINTNTTYNSAVADRMLSGFAYYGTDGTLCYDKDFGSFEVTSEDPLIVEYTIADEAVWSDGTPVTINDYLLDWATQNPEFIAPGLSDPNNETAKPVFTHVSREFADKVPDGPKGEPGSKKFTLNFSAPSPDFRVLLSGTMPSHVVAKKIGLESNQLAQAILDRDAATVTKAADFWNNGWIYNPGELPADMSEVPSTGPYKLKPGGWIAGNSLTLEANDKYWGEPAATKELVFRFIPDAGAPQALQNGDVQVIAPQATVDTVDQLKALGDKVKVYEFSTMTWEHLDFNHREGNVMANPKVREAFAYCVPRQQIVDTLVKPIFPDAAVKNAREAFLNSQPEKYKALVDASYDGRYDQVDLEKSKALLAESGVQTPVKVRLGYRSGNQRRQETVALIQASCNQAGFEVIDSNSEDYFTKELPNGETEVALFAWASSGQIISGQNIYSTDRPQNYLKYSNPKVDEAWEKVASTLDEETQLEQLKIIEKTLWDDLHGIPLYAHPGVAASDATLENVRPTAVQSGIWWNAQQWVKAS